MVSDLSLKEERGVCQSGYKLTWLCHLSLFLWLAYQLSRARAVCPVSLYTKSLAQCLVHSNHLPYFSWIKEQIYKWLVLRSFMWHTLASQGQDFILVLGDGRQGSVACVSTQWLGAQDAVCMEPDGRWPQIQPPVDSQLLITTCDNRRPPPSHPSGLGGGLPQGKSALRVFPMEVPRWPCLSLSRSWTVCGGPGVSHSYMDQNDGKGNNDKWFFLSKFPFLLYRPLICRAWSDL